MPLSQEDLRILELLKDPVLWARHELNIEARWYQAEILQNPSKRIVCRIGRRAGKTFTLQMKALHYAATHPNSDQIIVTPYQNQIDLIFQQMRDLLGNSRSLKDCITSSTKSPHYIQFTNGARIKGFTSGARSGQQAASLRGQRADWIYMDEMDYMTDADFETVYAIALQNVSGIGVWCSSTPSGRRGMFWKICSQPEIWTQFHYATSVIPNWDEDLEKELRATFTENGYIHEVLAEFGDEEAGVFNKRFVDIAKQPYAYSQGPMYQAIRICGVDWDKYGAAAQIIILEYEPFLQKFKVINRIEIPIGRFTLTTAVDTIVNLDKVWHFNWIYVDRGYGEHQVETLHKYGLQHPETGFEKKVVGASFSENVLIKDPFTKQQTKAMLKPFAVNQIALLLETQRLWISEGDQVVWKQMEQFRVDHINQNGQPVYVDEYDHALSALMLAVYAFYQRYPHILNTVPEIVNANKITALSSDRLYSLQQQEEAIRGLSWNGSPKLVWDEPGPPPPHKIPADTRRKPTPNSMLTRGSMRSNDISKGMTRKFW